MLPAAMKGAGEAIALTISLGAGYLLFCGLIQIMKALEVPQKLNRLLKPLLRLLMPSVKREETKQAVTMNLSANLLGLGNAATPMGMSAMRLMEQERMETPAVQHAMYMLLIEHSTHSNDSADAADRGGLRRAERHFAAKPAVHGRVNGSGRVAGLDLPGMDGETPCLTAC